MKDAVPIALMGCLFVLVYGLALLIVAPFEAAGLVAFENPNDPSNVVFFFRDVGCGYCCVAFGC
jgi:hypothetical protein